MNIKHFNIKRGAFSLAVEEMDLSRKGLYLLQGENGSGKTSFLESLLKSNNIQDISPLEKQNMIGYFSQNLYAYPATGYQYLKGCNEELVQEYCGYFSFDCLEKDITFLSGGEFVILALIRCFSKDTPILILDEPTNNLDNGMTKKVEALLNRLSQGKTILLSTHDKRLELQYQGIIQVKEGKASLGTQAHTQLELLPLIPGKKVDPRPLFKKTLFSRFNGLMFMVVLFCGLLTSMISSNYLLNEVPDFDQLPYDNVISLMWIAENYSTYIEATVSSAELEKQYAEKTDTLDAKEILTLAKKEYVEDIYVVDTGYLSTLQMGSADSLKIFSLPNVISDHPNYAGTFPGCPKFLLSGSLPKDNKAEAMISYEQMQKQFGYQGDINGVIGQKIKVHNKTYTVVGLTSLPYVTLSYDKNATTQYGVIHVSDHSIKALKKVLQQMKKLNYGSLIFEDIFIQYDKSYEKDLMGYLTQHGPSYQYSSSYVDETIEKASYIKMLPKVIGISLLLSMLLCIILIIMASRMFVLVGNQIRDGDNWNFRPGKNRLALVGVFGVDFLIMTLFSMIEAAWFLGSVHRLIEMTPFILSNLMVFGMGLWLMWKKYKRHG